MTKTEFMKRLQTEHDCCSGRLVAWIWDNRRGRTENHLFTAVFPLSYNRERVEKECWEIWKEMHDPNCARVG